jgi:hypothetical protein
MMPALTYELVKPYLKAPLNSDDAYARKVRDFIRQDMNLPTADVYCGERVLIQIYYDESGVAFSGQGQEFFYAPEATFYYIQIFISFRGPLLSVMVLRRKGNAGFFDEVKTDSPLYEQAIPIARAIAEHFDLYWATVWWYRSLPDVPEDDAPIDHETQMQSEENAEGVWVYPLHDILFGEH